ncbi:MAG: phenylacetate--CoA ligase family protein [Gammaproteobacteria bacterium]|nr:phenylacetate--CoA ligase family protein [Gammaproteobacteria bacterium]
MPTAHPEDDAGSLLARITPGISGIAWPALPGATGAAMLALQFQLDRSQWWPADVIARHQRRQLRALLAHARATVPFYEDRLAHLDLDGPDGLAESAFSTVPTLAREQVQTMADALCSRAVPGDHGGLVEYRTSGSTGRPVRVRGTRISDFWVAGLTLRDHLWHGRDLGGRLAAIRSKQTPGTGMGWGPATDCAFTTGPCSVLSSSTDIAGQARWLLAEDPHYLITQPSNLRALARHCLDQGLRPPSLREVRTFAEALPADLRATCAEAWGVPLTDCYSTNEMGYVALQCPQAEHYHVQAENVLVEVLDGEDRPCAPGQTGRIVVTPLQNYAMPLVRYELEDYAEVGAPCPCGRGLPVLARIHGRRRNMLRLPDGSRHWPSFPAQIWMAVAPIRQFQLVQVALHRIVIRLAVTRPLAADEQRLLYRLLDERLGWSFSYAIEYVDRIEGGLKFEDFVSRLDPAA